METEDIYTCLKCGVMMDFTIVFKEIGTYCGEREFEGFCPVCKTKAKQYI